MTFHRVVLLVALLTSCGCDRLGKGFAPPRMITTPPAPPVAAADRAVEPAPEAEPSETAPSEKEPAPAPLILYEDSFADVAGSIRRKVGGQQQPGEGPPASRTVYTFQATPEDGTLAMRIFEDNATTGPDGQPGVLALAWDEIPRKLDWSGFPYLGGAQDGKRMTIPKLQTARTTGDLRGLRLKFRYRGINANKSDMPVQISINCRLEPVLNDSYKHRIEFGNLAASDDWQTFDRSLADGANLDAALKALAEHNPPSFKIVWGQSLPITNYQAGDTLLIDDISVTSVPVPAGD